MPNQCDCWRVATPKIADRFPPHSTIMEAVKTAPPDGSYMNDLSIASVGRGQQTSRVVTCRLANSKTAFKNSPLDALPRLGASAVAHHERVTTEPLPRAHEPTRAFGPEQLHAPGSLFGCTVPAMPYGVTTSWTDTCIQFNLTPGCPAPSCAPPPQFWRSRFEHAFRTWMLFQANRSRTLNQ